MYTRSSHVSISIVDRCCPPTVDKDFRCPARQRPPSLCSRRAAASLAPSVRARSYQMRASAGEDRTVRFWDPATGKEVWLLGDTVAIRDLFHSTLRDIVQSDVALAALWVYEYRPQDKIWNVAVDNHRVWMLDAVAEANGQLRAERD